MTAKFQVRIFENGVATCHEEFDAPVEVGRQREGEDGPFSRRKSDDGWRMVIASIAENRIARRQLRIEPLPDGKLLLKNLSELAPLFLEGGQQLAPAGSITPPLPVSVQFGRKVLQVDGPATAVADPPSLNSLAEQTLIPGKSPLVARTFGRGSLQGLQSSQQIEQLIHGLQVVIDLLQSTTARALLFTKVAEAVVDLVGLDAGRVLLWSPEEHTWKLKAASTASGSENSYLPPASKNVLNRLQTEKRTFWQTGNELGAMEAMSLQGIDAVVAAPILNGSGDVIGAIYADRRLNIRAGGGMNEITKVEAMLVELLASGIASALGRLDQEEKAVKERTKFEQFFTRELSDQLEQQPDLLKGKDATITILFCDIRGFSRVSEGLGAAGVFEWINDVMGVLSDSVAKFEGVLVDYIGDELMAMWGAPRAQPDHAELACRAALDMLSTLPMLNERWEPIIKAPIDVGIGINTGDVRVGNTGSQRKFKYGPLGHTVNLASRVQGASKYFRSRLLITGPTFEMLRGQFPGRRLCDVRVVNIRKPVTLYELDPNADPATVQLRSLYETALRQFENRSFRQAAATLGNILGEHPDDGPSILLLSRTVTCIIDEPDPFDPVWDLPGK